MKREKKNVTYNMYADLVEQASVLSAVKKITMSEIMNDLLQEYLLKNKQEVNDYMLKYWNNEIDK